MMFRLDVPTKRGIVLNGVLFRKGKTDTVMIAITSIHGNFYSNPLCIAYKAAQLCDVGRPISVSFAAGHHRRNLADDTKRGARLRGVRRWDR